MSEYRGKHAPSHPWPVASTAAVPVRRGRHRKKSRRRRRVILIFILLLLVLVYPLAEARFLTVDSSRTGENAIACEDLPADANHLKVVFVSDIHWGYWYSDSDLSNLIAKIKSLQPDLVIFGGDYATDNASAVQFFSKLQSLSRSGFHARLGCYGVLGEADRGETDFDLAQVTDAMTNANVIPLVNQVEFVPIGSSRICIAGADDYLTGKLSLSRMASAVSAKDFVIFVAHNPSIIPQAQQALNSAGSLGWFDLGLFGHTHGGQMRIFSPMQEEIEDIPSRYLSGWLTENRVSLLISRGVGTSGFPGRLLCPAQIHLIELITD